MNNQDNFNQNNFGFSGSQPPVTPTPVPAPQPPVAPTPVPAPQPPVAPTPVPAPQPPINPMMYQQPIPQYPAQPSFSQPTMPPKKSNKKMIIIAIVIVILVVVAVVVAFLLSPKDKKKHDPVQEYEESNMNSNSLSNSNTNSNTPVSSNTQTYNGFEFTKLSGYNYYVEDNALYIENSREKYSISTVSANMEDVLPQYANLQPTFESQGFTVSNLTTATYRGRQLITCHLSKDGVNYMYYAMQSPSNFYMFEGLMANSSNTFDTSMYNTIADIVNSSKLQGNSTNFSNSLGSIVK